MMKNVFLFETKEIDKITLEEFEIQKILYSYFIAY